MAKGGKICKQCGVRVPDNVQIHHHLDNKSKSRALEAKKKVRTETDAQMYKRHDKEDRSFDKAYKNRFGK